MLLWAGGVVAAIAIGDRELLCGDFRLLMPAVVCAVCARMKSDINALKVRSLEVGSCYICTFRVLIGACARTEFRRAGLAAV